MSDLIDQLRRFAIADCLANDIALEERHVANMAADQLEQLQARVEELKGAYDWQKQELANKARKIPSLLAALNEIKEIYAGMEGIKTETAVEAYLIRIIEQMYAEATKTLAEPGEKE